MRRCLLPLLLISLTRFCLPATAGFAPAAETVMAFNYASGHYYRYNANGSTTDVTTTYQTLGYIYNEAGIRLDVTVDSSGAMHDWLYNTVGFLQP